jgi:hypothetical protein
MGAPDGYYEGLGWWWSAAAEPPAKSIFPDANGGPGWTKGQIPKTYADTKYDTQGWKLHICVQPAEIEGLFKLLSPMLQKVAHKFAPFEVYATQRTGYAAYQLIGGSKGDDAAGKACVIYPDTPGVIGEIVPKIDLAISTYNAKTERPQRIRPFPGGVKGDLALGVTGFIYTRYGAFSGKLADAKRLYDPISGTTCADPRFDKPFPDFITAIPTEIEAVRRK